MRRLLLVQTGIGLALAAATTSSAQSDSTGYFAPVMVITATRDRALVDELPAAATTVAARDIHRGERGVSLDEALRQVSASSPAIDTTSLKASA